MRQVTIIYGYHESGHFSVAEGIKDAFGRLGVDARIEKIFEGNSANWKTLFETFRSVNDQASLNFPDFFASETMLKVMATAVKDRVLEIDSDVIVSTHPYASYAIAENLPASNRLIYDVHTNYTPGPIFPHPRIDGFFTPILRPELAYRVRSRSVVCKVPLPPKLQPRENLGVSKRDWLITLGADGWGDTTDISQIERILPDSSLLNILVGRNAKALTELEIPNSTRRRVVPFQSDLSNYLTKAKFVFSKASGSIVTEALAHRCVPVFSKTYVPWELQAARHLVEAGVGIHLDDFVWMVSQFGAETIWKRYIQRASEFRAAILSAAQQIAETVVSGNLRPEPKLLQNPEIPTPRDDDLGEELKHEIRIWTGRQ